jgi:hypothetical protein
MLRRKLSFVVLVLFLASCTPKVQDIPTPVAIPTNTKSIIATLSALEIRVSQPEWFRDPDLDIIMIAYPDAALFMNPVTSETTLLEFSDARWLDSNHVAFSLHNVPNCASGETCQYIFNLTNWKINPVEIEFPENDSEKNAVPNFQVVRRDSATVLEIYNNQSQEWEVFLYPPPGLYNRSELFADNRVFVVQGDTSDGEGYVIAV